MSVYSAPNASGFNCSYYSSSGTVAFKDCYFINCGTNLTVTNCPAAGGGKCVGDTSAGIYINNVELVSQSDAGSNCGMCNYLTYTVPDTINGCRKYQLRQYCSDADSCGGIFTIYGGYSEPTVSPTYQPSSHPTVHTEPTGQPTGVPTKQPTTFPTMALESVISINVTHLFREVSAIRFNKQRRKCVRALAEGLADILELHPRESFVLHGKAVEYFNQIYDYDSMTLRDIPDGLPLIVETNNSGWKSFSSRKLGQTHGSVGTTLRYTLYIYTSLLGLSSTDEAYWNTRNDLLESIERQVFLDVVRVKAVNTGCVALAAIEGSTVSYISSDYLSNVLHSASPTSMPSIYPRVRRPYNFDGIVAGTIVGITAYVLLGMILLHFKYILGFDKPVVRVNDEPSIDI